MKIHIWLVVSNMFYLTNGMSSFPLTFLMFFFLWYQFIICGETHWRTPSFFKMVSQPPTRWFICNIMQTIPSIKPMTQLIAPQHLNGNTSTSSPPGTLDWGGLLSLPSNSWPLGRNRFSNPNGRWIRKGLDFPWVLSTFFGIYWDLMDINGFLNCW